MVSSKLLNLFLAIMFIGGGFIGGYFLYESTDRAEMERNREELMWEELEMLDTFLSKTFPNYKQRLNKIVKNNTEQEIWISPNLYEGRIGSKDEVHEIMSLLSEPNSEWENVKNKTHVFKFYMNTINDMSMDLLRQVIDALKGANILIAVEVGGLRDHYGCGEDCGENGAEVEIAILNRIIEAGGTIEYISLDNAILFVLENSHHSNNKCQYTVEEVARELIDYIKAVRRSIPNIKIGLLEAAFVYTFGEYPGIGKVSGDLREILDIFFRQLEEADEQIDFYHAECAYDKAKQTLNGLDKLKDMEAYIKSHGVKFGLTYNDSVLGDEYSDLLFFQNTLKYLVEYAEADGNPDHILIQSWWTVPTRVLPENQPYTFMYLVRMFLELLESP